MNVQRVVFFVCMSAIVGLAFVAPGVAQEPAKPGPEHEILKDMAGEWNATVTAMGQKSSGSMVYKLMPGGLWLTSDFKSEMMGQPFVGHGILGYDPAKKKYVSVWVDSMSTSPMTMEGTFDAGTKTITEMGEGPGMDGKPVKMKMTTEFKSKNEIKFTMHMPGQDGGMQQVMTIEYQRKK